MGLDNDLYAILNDGWDTAITEVVEEETVSIIAKPTFHGTEEEAIPQIRHYFINAKGKGKLNEDSNDNSMDLKVQFFTLMFYEGTEDELIKTLRITKTLIHGKAVTNGNYHIDEFDIDEFSNPVSCLLNGRLIKNIASDEF